MAQLPSINLRVVADCIQKKMCIYQKPDRNYAFVEVSQAADVFESDMPMIAKQLGHLAVAPRNRRGPEPNWNAAAASKMANAPERQANASGQEATDRQERAVATDLEKRRSSGRPGQLTPALDNVEFKEGTSDESQPVGR